MRSNEKEEDCNMEIQRNKLQSIWNPRDETPEYTPIILPVKISRGWNLSSYASSPVLPQKVWTAGTITWRVVGKVNPPPEPRGRNYQSFCMAVVRFSPFTDLFLNTLWHWNIYVINIIVMVLYILFLFVRENGFRITLNSRILSLNVTQNILPMYDYIDSCMWGAQSVP